MTRLLHKDKVQVTLDGTPLVLLHNYVYVTHDSACFFVANNEPELVQLRAALNASGAGFGRIYIRRLDQQAPVFLGYLAKFTPIADDIRYLLVEVVGSASYATEDEEIPSTAPKQQAETDRDKESLDEGQERARQELEQADQYTDPSRRERIKQRRLQGMVKAVEWERRWQTLKI